ncbi:Transcriptional activator of glycolytic enzyme [Phytophthora infestans]|uniref:Transcriptional activator of glycolytic enzyme n=1 Tax=Phytophthora infestans TaxID=4787 RepID=A0A833WHS7_PHYIN|nr:Transcriptional activator of glycolytic enzyme [Phytophthora infestans]
MSLQNMERNLNGVMQTIVPLSCGTAVVEVRLVPNASATSTTASFQPGVVEPSPVPSAPTTPPVSYALSRSLVSVHDLWKEWSVGLNGGPAVSVLEEKYGTKWCNSDERRFFNRRRRVITLVKEISAQLADSGVSDDITAAQLTVDALEGARKSQKKSLNWMSNNPEVIIGLARSALRIDAPTVPAGQHNV